MFPNTLNNDSMERISRALGLLNWRHGLVFYSLMDGPRSAVLQAMHSKQLTMKCEYKGAVYYMSRAEAAKLKNELV